MAQEPEYDPTPVGADTAPEHLEAIATTDAVLELPPEQSGFGEGNVGEVLLDIEGLSKSFGSVNANRDITMHVRRGEIVALLGENGAGKSTLVNQIFGLITPDTGTVSVRGDATPIKDPRDAIRRGIGMVHQHFQLVPVMTVAENMVLGQEPTRAGQVLDIAGARELVRTLSAKHGLPVDPDADVLDAGCCGLAGNFGFQVGHGEVSEACAERALLPRLREAAPGAVVLADGFSCRTQIHELEAAAAKPCTSPSCLPRRAASTTTIPNEPPPPWQAPRR